MNNKGLLVVLVLSLAMNASVLGTVGYRYYWNSWWARSAACPLSPTQEHLYKELGLSTQQLTEIEPLARKFHERLAELGSAMKGKNSRLVELLGRGDIDPVQVEGVREEMAGIQEEIQKEVIAHILEFKKILDSEQQERFFALLHQSMAGDNRL